MELETRFPARQRQLLLVQLGLEPYSKALDLQHRLAALRSEGRIGDVLILLEHPSVITLGRNADAKNIVATQAALRGLGIEVHRVERGGDVTYHGPGQLVCYPILDLSEYGKDVGWYMHSLEEVTMRTLADFGIAAQRDDKNIGVWVEGRKIAALGVRIENWITYHGLALNVCPDLSHFGLIVPCGLREREVTSMEKVLGAAPSMNAVRKALVRHFREVFRVQLARGVGPLRDALNLAKGSAI